MVSQSIGKSSLLTFIRLKINSISEELSRIALIGLLTFNFPCRAQEPRCFIVLKSKSKEPVAYVSVRSGSLDVFADGNGTFCTSSNLNEIFPLTRIGYEPATARDISLRDTIYMDRSINLIKELTVVASSKIYELGYHRSKTIGDATAGDGSTKAVFVKSDQKNARIVSILVSTRRNCKGITQLASLFAVGEDGKPGDLIYS